MSGDNFWLLRERSRDLGLPAELQGWLKAGEFRCSPDSQTCGWTGEKSDVPFRLLAVVFVALGGLSFTCFRGASHTQSLWKDKLSSPQNKRRDETTAERRPIAESFASNFVLRRMDECGRTSSAPAPPSQLCDLPTRKLGRPPLAVHLRWFHGGWKGTQGFLQHSDVPEHCETPSST